MEKTCAEAVRLGLPAVAFTEHVDRTPWVIDGRVRTKMSTLSDRIGEDGRLHPPPLDTGGYLRSIDACRERYPQLRIVTGVEVGEPHWYGAETDALLSAGSYDRVLGSVHSIMIEGDPWMVDDLFEDYAPEGWSAPRIVRAYLAEARRMVVASSAFAVLAHIDYPVRKWPAGGAPFDPQQCEQEYRSVLEALAESGRALEVNTRVPLHPTIVRWWYEAGGDAVSFGSDAHLPAAVGRGFAAASDMVEASGFAAGRDRYDFWRRRR